MSTPYIAKALELGAGEWFVLGGVDGPTWKDESGRGHDHTIVGATVDQEGGPGPGLPAALVFDGVDDFAYREHHPDFNRSQQPRSTWFGWWRSPVTQQPNLYAVVASKGRTNDTYRQNVSYSSVESNFHNWWGSNLDRNLGTVTNEWNFFAFVVDQSGDFILYVRRPGDTNVVEIDRMSYPNTIEDNGSPHTVGCRAWLDNGIQTERHWTGPITGIGGSSEALTPAQLDELYESAFEEPTGDQHESGGGISVIQIQGIGSGGFEDGEHFAGGGLATVQVSGVGLGAIYEESPPHTVGPPPDDVINAVHAGITRVTRRVDIYEADGETLWMGNAPILGGSVTLDIGRSERRNFSLTLHDEDGNLSPHPGGLWYDKVIKIYRGVITPFTTWEAQLGEFLIDGVDRTHFPNQVSLSGRDYAKKLMNAKFAAPTEFGADPETGLTIPDPMEEIIRVIAINGGISPAKIDFPLTGVNITRPFFFDRDKARWEAMVEVATAYNYEVYFDHTATLRLRRHADPYLDDPVFIFRTGKDPKGNIASFTKAVSDARVRNHIVVTGEATDTLPAWAEAKNEDENSPTSIQNIGIRTETISSPLIDTDQQAEDIANEWLTIYSMEQFNLRIDALVMPWLDVSNVVKFEDPNPAPDDPEKFLLQGLTIPLDLTTMSVEAGRIRLAG